MNALVVRSTFVALIEPSAHAIFTGGPGSTRSTGVCSHSSTFPGNVSPRPRHNAAGFTSTVRGVRTAAW